LQFYTNGQIIGILKIIKIPLYREFLQFIKTTKLLQFIKNGQIIAILLTAIKKRPNYCNYANYKNSPLYGVFAIYKNDQIVAIYKNGQIIAILQIAIKNGQIIAILKIIKIPLYRELLQFIKTTKSLQFILQC
jgi:hypothetical protein